MVAKKKENEAAVQDAEVVVEAQALAPQIQPKPFYLSFLSPVNGPTVQALIATAAKQLSEGFNEMHLLLSTPGGEVQSGIAAYNILRAMPFKVVSYNVGSVNSIGNVIFLSGDERYAATTSSFMFHGVGFDIQKARFEQKDLDEKLANLKNDQTLIAAIIERHTSMKLDDIGKLFLQAAFVPANDAKERGIVNDVIDINVPKGAPFLQLVFQG